MNISLNYELIQAPAVQVHLHKARILVHSGANRYLYDLLRSFTLLRVEEKLSLPSPRNRNDMASCIVDISLHIIYTFTHIRTDILVYAVFIYA